MLFQKKRLNKEKRCRILCPNNDWILRPSGSSFPNLTASEQNAFISSWILWALIPLNSADLFAKTEDAFCWPTDESFWVGGHLGSTRVAEGEGRLKSTDPLHTWHSAYSRTDFCRCLLRININRCVLKPRTSVIHQITKTLFLFVKLYLGWYALCMVK